MIVHVGGSRFAAFSRRFKDCAGLRGRFAVAVAVAGCKNSAQVFEDNNEGGWFSKKVDVFAKPDWAMASDARRPILARTARSMPTIWSAPMAAAQWRPPRRRLNRRRLSRPRRRPTAPVGSMAGDLAGAPMPAHAGLGLSQRQHARRRRTDRAAGHGRHRARHDRMPGGAARRLAGQRRHQHRRERRAQGRAHLSHRRLAGHLSLLRRPAEGNRPRAGAAGAGKAGEKAESQEAGEAEDRRPVADLATRPASQ